MPRERGGQKSAHWVPSTRPVGNAKEKPGPKCCPHGPHRQRPSSGASAQCMLRLLFLAQLVEWSLHSWWARKHLVWKYGMMQALHSSVLPGLRWFTHARAYSRDPVRLKSGSQTLPALSLHSIFLATGTRIEQGCCKDLTMSTAGQCL